MALAVYFWLYHFFARSKAEMVRTHKRRMKWLVERFAKNMTWFLLYAVALVEFQEIITPVPSASNGEQDQKRSDLNLYLLILPFFTIITALPFALVAIIYYSEVRRLRLVLKDFLFLMRRAPFAFDAVAEAYFEMLGEWNDVQTRLGPVSNLMTGVMSLDILQTVIVILYRGKSRIYPPPNFADAPQMVEFEYVHTTISSLIILPVLLCMIYSAAAINERVADIDDQVVLLLSSSALAAPIDDAGEGPLLAREDDDVETGHHPSIALNGINVMKFASIVEKRPCEIILCGRKFTKGDVLNSVGIALIVVAINLLGLNDFLG